MKPWLVGALGVLLASLGMAADLLLIHVPAIRNGWWTLIPLGLGTVMSIAAMRKDRNWLTIVCCFFVGWPGGYYVYLKFQERAPGDLKVEIGKDFPGAALFDQDEHIVQLDALWRTKPLVVVLNRGGWSFLDKGELRGLCNAYQDIVGAGAGIVSITTEKPEQRKKTADAIGATFPLLSDEDRRWLAKLGMVHEGGGPEGAAVAVPATFLVDTAGKLRWMHRAPTLRERPAPADIIAAVKALK